jgi:hypothetical protein
MSRKRIRHRNHNLERKRRIEGVKHKDDGQRIIENALLSAVTREQTEHCSDEMLSAIRHGLRKRATEKLYV